ncbi:MAG: hypothetical protein FJ308_19170 [Planctomycetes bacterium]|nr:hypothetical protein [Planctomycetota bacterium]
MKKLKPFVPALISFGPVLVVIGLTGDQLSVALQVVAYSGAVMLALGFGWLYMACNSAST